VRNGPSRIDADRAGRRGILASDMSPSRQRQRSLCSVALACVVVVLLASCHGSSKHAAPKGSKPSTNDKGQPAVSLSLGLGALTVQAAGKAVPFNRSIATSIRDVMNKYIAVGITKPLFTGASASGMVAYFAPSLAKRVGPKGHDLAALSDEGMPTIIDVTGTAKGPLSLVGLEDHRTSARRSTGRCGCCARSRSA
jgi:hypothetical protein